VFAIILKSETTWRTIFKGKLFPQFFSSFCAASLLSTLEKHSSNLFRRDSGTWFPIGQAIERINNDDQESVRKRSGGC
jgi:hypothetical protein